MARHFLRFLTPLSSLVNAHLFMGNPAPFRWSENIDKLIMPMNGDSNHQGEEWGQQQFPCKGYHADLAQSNPQTVWNAGEVVTIQLYDSNNKTGIPGMHDPVGAAHGGGSCQISFSYDGGKSWVVVQSWEGNCPRVRKGQEGQATNTYDVNQDYKFQVPEHFPSGEKVIVAWTWLNAVGNREYYMSCSPVVLKGGNSSAQAPLGSSLLVANLRANPQGTDSNDWLWSRCHTLEGTWIRYPEKYKGLNMPIQAEAPPEGSPIDFSDFEDPEAVCSSNNTELVQALSGKLTNASLFSLPSSVTRNTWQTLSNSLQPTLISSTRTRGDDPLWAVPTSDRWQWVTSR